MNISIRPLTAKDAAELDDFLSPHTAEAYYLRTNALSAGLVYEGKALQAEYFGAFKNGGIVGAIAYSWTNNVLLYAADPDCLTPLAQAALPSIHRRGGVIDAILGLAPHVDAVVRELNIPQYAFRKWGDDGLFLLSLDRLSVSAMPDGISLRLARKEDRALLIDWRISFNLEANGAKLCDALRTKVEKEIDHWLESKDTFLLEKEGAPVSFCGINISVPEMAIIGPVWTPVDFRNRGYAKLVTGHGLKKLLSDRPALREATLFAIRPDAVRVYESLGFQRIADWRLALLKEDFRIHKKSQAE